MKRVKQRKVAISGRLQRFTPLDWSHKEQSAQAEHNAFLVCDKFERPLWVELLPAEGPDSDAFDEELYNELSQHRASPYVGHGGCFFPRVRTPCGHGAQVIVEGREEQTDGGERNEGPKTNPNQTPKPAGRNSTIL